MTRREGSLLPLVEPTIAPSCIPIEPTIEHVVVTAAAWENGERLGVTHGAVGRLTHASSTHAMPTHLTMSTSSTNMYSQRDGVLVSTLYLPASQLQFSVVCYLQWEAGKTIVESWQGKQH